MDQSVIALYDSYSQAEKAVQTLQESGYENKFSVFMKKQGANQQSTNENEQSDDNIGTLANLGAIAGFSLGVVAYAVPGLSPIMAGGPLAGINDGSATGSFMDALGEEGYVENDKKYIAEQLMNGKIMIVVHGEYGDLPAAHQILTSSGGEIVETSNMTEDTLEEAYQLEHIPVEQPADEIIAIPAHLIDDESYIDPNIGYGDYDLINYDEGMYKPDEKQ